MATFALITNGIVINTVVCDSEQLTQQLWPNVLSINIDDITPTPGIGWSYMTGSFAPPVIETPPQT